MSERRRGITRKVRPCEATPLTDFRADDPLVTRTTLTCATRSAEAAAGRPDSERKERTDHTCTPTNSRSLAGPNQPRPSDDADATPHERLPNRPVPRPDHRPRRRPLGPHHQLRRRPQPLRLLRPLPSQSWYENGFGGAGLAHEPMDAAAVVPQVQHRAVRVGGRRLVVLGRALMVVIA